MTNNLFIVNYLDEVLLANPDWYHKHEPAVVAVFAVGEEEQALAAAREQFAHDVEMTGLVLMPLPSNVMRE